MVLTIELEGALAVTANNVYPSKMWSPYREPLILFLNRHKQQVLAVGQMGYDDWRQPVAAAAVNRLSPALNLAIVSSCGGRTVSRPPSLHCTISQFLVTHATSQHVLPAMCAHLQSWLKGEALQQVWRWMQHAWESSLASLQRLLPWHCMTHSGMAPYWSQ